MSRCGSAPVTATRSVPRGGVRGDATVGVGVETVGGIGVGASVGVGVTVGRVGGVDVGASVGEIIGVGVGDGVGVGVVGSPTHAASSAKTGSNPAAARGARSNARFLLRRERRLRVRAGT